MNAHMRDMSSPGFIWLVEVGKDSLVRVLPEKGKNEKKKDCQDPRS